VQAAELEAALRPLLKARTPTVFQEGEKRLKKPRSAWTKADMERFLKRIVFPALQFDLSPAQARAEVEGLLARLGGEDEAVRRLSALEAAARRFALFIDWPEALRLRRLVAGLKEEWDPAQAAEAEAVVAELEEKLESRLIAQEKALAELKELARRVEKVGGKKVRRLSMLIRELEFAQKEGLLATAELEEAQALAHELAKLIESSAIEVADEAFDLEIDLDFESGLTDEQALRIRALDLEEERRRLARLKDRFGPLFARPAFAEKAEAIEARLQNDELAGEALDALEAELKEAYQDLLAEARARLVWAAERLRELGEPPALTAQLKALEEALQNGVYPEGLEELEAEIEAQKQAAARAQAAAREAKARQKEIEDFIENARKVLSGDDLKALDQLAEELGQGRLDEARLARLRQAYLAGLEDRAETLKARLRALPQDLANPADVEAALADGRLDEAEAKLEALEAEARNRAKARLEELKRRAQRFGVLIEEIERAEQALEDGQWPALQSLALQLENAIEEKRRQARAHLARLKRTARRFRGLGGEALLEKIAAAERELEAGLPDLEALEAEAEALARRREALKAELKARFEALTQEFERYRRMTGETRSRLGALVRFLQAGFARIDRIGTQGLFELKRGLDEAEALLEQLRAEHAAARDLAAELKDVNFDELLGVFEEEASPWAELGFASARLDAFGLSGELELDADRLAAWIEAGRQLSPETEALILIKGETALVVRPKDGYDEVLLGPRRRLAELLARLSEA